MSYENIAGQRTLNELLDMTHYGKLWLVVKKYPDSKKIVCSRVGRSGEKMYVNDKDQKTFKAKSTHIGGFRFELVDMFDIIVVINGEGKYDLIKTGNTLFKGMTRDGKRYKKACEGNDGLPGSDVQAQDLMHEMQCKSSS